MFHRWLEAMDRGEQPDSRYAYKVVEKTVRSVTARQAPGSIRCGVGRNTNAVDTDGNIFPETVGPSALGIITGFPPITTAAAEFVVPRSIPKIFSFFSSLIFYILLIFIRASVLGYLYHGCSKDFPFENITFPELLSNMTIFNIFGFHF